MANIFSWPPHNGCFLKARLSQMFSMAICSMLTLRGSSGTFKNFTFLFRRAQFSCFFGSNLALTRALDLGSHFWLFYRFGRPFLHINRHQDRTSSLIQLGAIAKSIMGVKHGGHIGFMQIRHSGNQFHDGGIWFSDAGGPKEHVRTGQKN